MLQRYHEYLFLGHAQAVGMFGEEQFSTHDFESWLRLEERPEDWPVVNTVSSCFCLPSIIVLAVFDRLPRKEVKFSSSEQTEVIKIQQDKEKLIDKEVVKQEVFQTNQQEDKSSPIIKEKPINEDIKYEPIPTKKIKPKIKPKPKIEVEKDSDVIVKIKQKPKQSFNIASVLKDLRKENIQTNTGNEKEEEKSEKKDKESSEDSSNLTINEIDLLKQQLYGCWTVPAGAKGAKDMEVKVRVWVNPDRTVNNARILDTNRMQSDPYFRSVAESALRAVLNPACNSLKLPPDKYEIWKKFVFKFELEWMLGN